MQYFSTPSSKKSGKIHVLEANTSDVNTPEWSSNRVEYNRFQLNVWKQTMLELNYSKNKVLQVSVQLGSHTFKTRSALEFIVCREGAEAQHSVADPLKFIV